MNATWSALTAGCASIFVSVTSGAFSVRTAGASARMIAGTRSDRYLFMEPLCRRGECRLHPFSSWYGLPGQSTCTGPATPARFRDAVDMRTAAEVEAETGTIIDSRDQLGGWSTLESSPAPLETDGDGSSDEWETAHGLDPLDPSDGSQVTASGYTNREVYLNELVSRGLPGPFCPWNARVRHLRRGKASRVGPHRGRGPARQRLQPPPSALLCASDWAGAGPSYRQVPVSGS